MSQNQEPLSKTLCPMKCLYVLCIYVCLYDCMFAQARRWQRETERLLPLKKPQCHFPVRGILRFSPEAMGWVRRDWKSASLGRRDIYLSGKKTRYEIVLTGRDKCPESARQAASSFLRHRSEWKHQETSSSKKGLFDIYVAPLVFLGPWDTKQCDAHQSKNSPSTSGAKVLSLTQALWQMLVMICLKWNGKNTYWSQNKF